MEINQKIANPTRGWEKLIVKEANYWVAEDKVYPKEVANCLERAFGLSCVGAIPLKLEKINYGNVKKEELKLIKTQIRLLPKSYFEVPVGFEQAKSIQDIYGQASPEMVDMFK
ncbi:MAG: hypothetical protein HC888_10620 [Candidatus Competibacteraceae bacterium]|nr:hypothetical protein [Candidatus Competibacteraceae bacterium]